MRQSLGRCFGVASLLLGGVIGAGFATGQEVYQFFSYSGYQGVAAILVVLVLTFLLCRATLDLANQNHYRDFSHCLCHLLGGMGGSVAYTIFTAFLFTVFGVMGSSFAALLEEQMEMPHLVGFLLYLVVMAVVMMGREERLTQIAKIFTPFMVAGTLVICLYVMCTRDVQTFAGLGFGQNNGAYLLSALCYFGYNGILAVSVLCTFGGFLKNKKEVRLTSLLCAGAFGLCLLVLYGALFCYYGEIEGLELPMMYLASLGGEAMLRLYSLILFCAIVTTGAGCGYVLCRGMGQGKHSVFVLCTSSICFAMFDFSFLIRNCYGFFGVLGLVLCLWVMAKEKVEKS